jgi:cytochrome b
MTSTAKRMTDETAAPAAAPTARIAVWDLPTRVFHWILVGLIAFSWWTGKKGEEDLHFYSGYAVLTLLIFRLLWGFFGSSTARFSSFVRGPRAVADYVGRMRTWPGIGHTPLGALSVVALMLLLFVQVATGLIQTDDDGLVEGPLAPLVSYDVSDAAHELHEVTFNVLLVLIGLHVAAVLFYRFGLGKKLLIPMVTGRAQLDPSTEPMRPGKGWVAIICLIAALGLTRWIIAGAPPLG